MWSLLEKIEKNIVEQEVNVVVDEISILFFLFFNFRNQQKSNRCKFYFEIEIKIFES